MKLIGLCALTLAGALVSLSATARGDTTIVQAPAESSPGYRGPPNVPLLTTGIVTFGLSYVPAIVVAGESTQSADHNLYVPIAGPWMDIASRPRCGVVGGPDCTTETTDQVLIGVDGVFQAVGAVETVFGLLTPEHPVVTTVSKHQEPTLKVSPTRVGSGYGLGAIGTW